MSYLIDGHNLIPHIRGFSLTDLDDEESLIRLLQDFCRVRRRKVEVFFDRGAVGQKHRQPRGLVLAIFVPHGMTADEAIRRRLIALGKTARNYTVVSSDRQVQGEARSKQARVVSSEAFATELMEAQQEAFSSGTTADPNAAAADVEEWLRLFGQDEDRK